MEDGPAYTIVAIIGIFGTFFNTFTLLIVFSDRKIRKKASYVPITSFLIGSAIQGATAFPIYVFRKLESHLEHFTDGICDSYRVPYFFCGHIMKLSLFYVSIDRLVAIKYPYVYQEKMTTKRFVIAMCISWVVTILIDIVPFIAPSTFSDDCIYQPNHEWGITVITFYNIIPLITIIVCYSIIWRTAVRIAIQDKALYKSTQANTVENKEAIKKEDKHAHKTVGDDIPSLCCIMESVTQPQRKNSDFGIKEAAKTITGKATSGLKSIQQGLEMKATKTSLALVITYIVCWGPLGIFYMIDHFCSFCYSAKDELSSTRTGIKILAFTSSFLAPLTYCWWNKDFRDSAAKLAKKILRKS